MAIRPLHTTALIAMTVTLVLLSVRADAQVTSYAYIPSLTQTTVTIIDTRQAAVTGPTMTGGTNGFAAVQTPDGRLVYVISTLGANNVRAFDAVTGTQVGATLSVSVPFDPLFGNISNPYSLAVTPDGRQVYVADQSGSQLGVIDVATNTLTTEFATGFDPVSIAFTPDGQRAYVALNTPQQIAQLDVATNTFVGAPISLPGRPVTIVMAPDGQHAYAADQTSNTVSVIDIASNAVTATIPVGVSPYGLAITPDGQTLFVTNSNSNNVSVIDVSTNLPVVGSPIAVGSSPRGVDVTPDGKTAYVVNQFGSGVSLIDVATLAVTTTIPMTGQQFAHSAFIGPNILTTACPGCGALAIAGDADLTARGFKAWVVFNSGVLQLTGDWTSSRRLSLLRDGGTIDTNGHDAAVSGDVINDGALTKSGAGRLTLTGTSTHTGGTTVTQGALIVNGTHAPAIHVQGATLGGSGVVGTVDVASNGTIAPGIGGIAVLTATDVTFAAGSTFAVRVNGVVSDLLDVSGTATLTQPTLSVQMSGAPLPSGTTFKILTHAVGVFAGLPEGARVAAGTQRFRITYQGGSGADVLLTADAPPSLDGLTNQTMIAGHALPPIALTVNDDLTASSALAVSATSSNQSLLPDADIVSGGSGSARTLMVTPVPGAAGTATITVTVSDGFQTTTGTFQLTVTPTPVYYLAEGSTGGFFSTDILIANPNPQAAPATIRFFTSDGAAVVKDVTLPPTSRLTVRVNDIAGLESAAFSTSVVSTDALPLVVERTMWWDGSGYGASTEKASAGAASQWYFAEGSQGFFHTYYLLLNPHAVATVAHVTFFPEDGPALSRDYAVSATSRRTIDAATEPALMNRSFGALVSFDLPGMAERAMYFGTTPIFSGGTAAAGTTTPATTWYLAEGATGTFFDTFVLIANPNDIATDVTMTYLPASGAPITRTHTVAAHTRLTVNISTEDPSLVSAAMSTRVDATHPVIAERSQYWPHGNWYEAHNSAGETSAGTTWGLAEGRVGGANHAQTYILLANPGAQPAEVTATFLRETGTPVMKTFTIAPTSRLNIAVTGEGGSDVPELVNENFGTSLVSTQPIIVERSLYTDANGVVWAAGTHATGTRLP